MTNKYPLTTKEAREALARGEVVEAKDGNGTSQFRWRYDDLIQLRGEAFDWQDLDDARDFIGPFRIVETKPEPRYLKSIDELEGVKRVRVEYPAEIVEQHLQVRDGECWSQIQATIIQTALLAGRRVEILEGVE